MRPAPCGADQAWTAVLAMVAPAFTRPSHAIFVDLMCGWVLTPGRRTITRIIGVIDPDAGRAHDAYHRLVRDGVWSMARLWQPLAVAIVTSLVPPGAPVLIDIDDTLFHRTGRHVEGAGRFRDAVRSARNRTVWAFGLNVVVATVRVRPPWPGCPIGLPIAARVRRKGDGPTTVELARQMLADLASWLPGRDLEVACDGAYATLAGANLDRVNVTSRLRRDAAVFELTPPRTGRRGRPRKKGDRLPPLADMATAARFITVDVEVRGVAAVRQVWSRTLLWYSVCADRPVMLVVVRDPDGIQPDDFYITTNLAATPAWIAGHYAGRWSIEVTFRDTKQHLGGQPQSWKRAGPARAAALALWLHAATWLWYLTVWGARRSWTPTPWYARKAAPSFADALAALRTTLWTQRISQDHPHRPLPPKIRDQLIDVLAHAA